MSRAYRIRVRESLRKVVRAEDHVSTQLELLALLPPEQMADLLAAELCQRGFQRQGDRVVRKQNGADVTVELATGAVTVKAATTEEINIEAENTGYATDQRGESAKELQKSLKHKAELQKAALQAKVTDQLEAELGDLRKELDQVVNRVTAEALKRKAAQLGTIKQVTEDAQSGSMTIVLEV
jgi:hypothetical protein